MGIFRLVEGNGKVHKVEVKILETKLLQAVVKSSLNMLRTVLRVPELGCEEKVLTLEAWDLRETLLKGSGDFLLVAVTI